MIYDPITSPEILTVKEFTEKHGNGLFSSVSEISYGNDEERDLVESLLPDNLWTVGILGWEEEERSNFYGSVFKQRVLTKIWLPVHGCGVQTLFSTTSLYLAWEHDSKKFKIVLEG